MQDEDDKLKPVTIVPTRVVIWAFNGRTEHICASIDDAKDFLKWHGFKESNHRPGQWVLTNNARRPGLIHYDVWASINPTTIWGAAR